jgi:uncharacterized protein (TIGR02391 family)
MLHCRRIAGHSYAYAEKIDRLEDLETQLEDATSTISFHRWDARRKLMRGLIDQGKVTGQDNAARVASFMVLIQSKLAAYRASPSATVADLDEALAHLLHPVIAKSSREQFCDGHLRDAVLNAYIALGDLVRTRTGLLQDGKALAEQALSMQSPRLILSDLTSESGRNDQAGFMQLLAGAFVGIRNPKAHSLTHDLTAATAAQYLVFASLLARRVSEAKEVQ